MTALSLLQFFVVEAAGCVQVDEVPCERLSKESSLVTV